MITRHNRSEIRCPKRLPKLGGGVNDPCLSVTDTTMRHARPMMGVSHNPMKGASMRLSRLAMGLCGVIVLSLAVLVGASSARTSAHRGQTLTIATVNNPDMIVMQSLTSDFTK